MAGQAFRGGHEGARVTIPGKGAGIPPAVQWLIFDPFFTTKELKGSGLGLWVSRTLILNHSGDIRFRSFNIEGKSGTSFRVFVPAMAWPPNRPNAAPEAFLKNTDVLDGTAESEFGYTEKESGLADA